MRDVNTLLQWAQSSVIKTGEELKCGQDWPPVSVLIDEANHGLILDIDPDYLSSPQAKDRLAFLLAESAFNHRATSAILCYSCWKAAIPDDYPDKEILYALASQRGLKALPPELVKECVYIEVMTKDCYNFSYAEIIRNHDSSPTLGDFSPNIDQVEGESRFSKQIRPALLP